MKITNEKLKEILISQSYLTNEEASQYEKDAQAMNTSMKEYIVLKNILTKDLIGQAIAEFLEYPYADLKAHPPLLEQLHQIPENLAQKHNMVLFKYNNESVVIASDNPLSLYLVTELKKIFKTRKIFFSYALPEDIQSITHSYRKDLENRFEKIIAKHKQIAPEIIDEIINEALTFNTSDIHIEPQSDEVIIRFRIDGILQNSGTIPKEYYNYILNRIKVLARLRTDEHFAAQDGSFHHETNDREVDIRISIVPTIEGEKVVMRLLSQYIRSFSMQDLGLSARDQQSLSLASMKPFGMILIVGPTGSGKSTSLYALMKQINRPGINISTIEDPVEYRIKTINQIQVNQRTNLTFAEGLRSLVRQDPDIILVGEIRDQETAEIAINAALTGHLLFSTFHANDAPTAIPRLLDMGVEKFLLASTLEVIVSQRLVRKICPNCRYSYNTTDQTIINLLIENTPLSAHNFCRSHFTLYKGKGCNNCNFTGYKGRSALFEFININQKIKDVILTNPTTKKIWQVAKEEGAKSLFEDGLDKVRNGITTLEEVKRVAAPKDD